MFNFLHTFQPQRVIFQIGPITIYWYGLLVVVGMILGLLVVLKLAKYYQIKKEQVFDLAFYLIIFGFLGARLYEVLVISPYYYFSNPIEIFKVWQGGLAIHGLIIGGIATLIVYCYRKKQSFFFWADILAPALILGQAIGRFGNYFNQELFGKPTDLPWGIPIDFINRVPPNLLEQYFHPTFLYESALNLLIFGVLIFWHWRRIQQTNNSQQLTINSPSPSIPLPLKGERVGEEGGLNNFSSLPLNLRGGNEVSPLKLRGVRGVINYGNIFFAYLILYSLVRFSLEFIRIDETPLLLGLRLPQLVSLAIILLTLAVWSLKNRLFSKPSK